MNTETLKSVLEQAVELNGGRQNSYRADTLPENLYDLLRWSDKAVAIPGYVVKHEQTQGGGEGDGEEFWMVLSITDTTTGEVEYVRFDGYYQSYDGHEFHSEDFEIVKPVQVQVTQWDVK